MDFEESLKHDIKLLRESPAVPKHIELYGLFYEINSARRRLGVNIGLIEGLILRIAPL